MLWQYKKHFITHYFIWPTKELVVNYHSCFMDKEICLSKSTLMNITKNLLIGLIFFRLLSSVPFTTWLPEWHFFCLKSCDNSPLCIYSCAQCGDLWALYSPVPTDVQIQELENVFCEAPDSKYFRLHGLYICQSYTTVVVAWRQP